MPFVSHLLIPPDTIEERAYQTNIARHALDGNTLVVLPTGMGKTAVALRVAAERLALMEKYRSTVDKYDACILRLAYTYNAVGKYRQAYDILTTRRFHVWEGSEGLLAPFVEACIGLGRAEMAKNDYRKALAYFEESTTYPANLQAGRPGDAGTEPKSRYYMAQCKKHLGDDAGYKAELENSLKGWIKAGEMDYWRVKALRELGRDAECAPLIAELEQAIRELEAPAPVVISAYAKFGGENSPMERAAKAREKAGFLRDLLKELESPSKSASDEKPVTFADHASISSMTLDCAYPGGNVRILSIDDAAGVVRLAPDLRDTEGHWFHFDFTVRGVAGRTLKFRFPQDGNLYLSTLGPAICKDGVHWTWLNADGKRHEPANAFDYTFGKTDHAVRFALSIPYVQKDWEAFTAKWRMSI